MRHDLLPFCFPKSSVTSRYVGPRKAETPYDVPVPRGGGICRYKQELVVGNVSKWLEEEGEREGMATHKWMLYVRGGKSSPDLSAVVSRVEVRLFVNVKLPPRWSCTPPTLHITWLKSQPHLSTSRGVAGVRIFLFSNFASINLDAGEFPLKLKIHFRHPEDRPLAMEHQV